MIQTQDNKRVEQVLNMPQENVISNGYYKVGKIKNVQNTDVLKVLKSMRSNFTQEVKTLKVKNKHTGLKKSKNALKDIFIDSFVIQHLKHIRKPSERQIRKARKKAVEQYNKKQFMKQKVNRTFRYRELISIEPYDTYLYKSGRSSKYYKIV